MQTSDEKPDQHFPKAQKLYGDKAISELFEKGQAFTKHPFRVVYQPLDTLREGEAAVRMMISVGKKKFKRAVKRNRVKRQTREAWRKTKYIVEETIAAHGSIRGVRVAFIYCGDGLPKSSDVERGIEKAALKLSTILKDTTL